ncbi:MAG: flagellar hook-length control protein FliK [Lactobacillus sp.]|jgi:flagellar hook-length control protein FliK|nr:flagellar hook-length control protein FliK [Lactobacillus sp.]
MELKENITLASLSLLSRLNFGNNSGAAELMSVVDTSESKVSFSDVVREHQSKAFSSDSTASKDNNKVEAKITEDTPVKKEAKEKTSKASRDKGEKSADTKSKRETTAENSKSADRSEQTAAAKTPAVENEAPVEEALADVDAPAKVFDMDDLESFAAIAMFQITDNITGETWEMSGQEYFENMDMFENLPNLTVRVMNEDGEPVMDFMAFTDDEGNIIQLSQDALKAPLAEEESVNTQAVASKPVEDEALLSKQAAKIAEIVGEDTKLKVEVNVKDNKAESFASKPLVAQVVDADDADLTLDTQSQPDTQTLLDTAASENTSNDLSVADLMIMNQDGAEVIAQPQVNVAPTQVQDASTLAAKGADNASVISNGSVSTAGFVASTKINGTEQGRAQVQDTYKGMSSDVIEQVKINITKQAVKGIDKIDIQLKPESLGKVDVKLHIAKDGKIQAHITASNSDALEALQKDSSVLQKALNDSGFNTEEGSLSFSLREEQNNQNQDDLRKFMGKALEIQEDIQPDLLAESFWDGKSALNIKV